MHLLELQEICTYRNLRHRGEIMGLRDFENAKQWNYEVMAAYECGVITKEMRDLLYEVLGALEKGIQESQKSWTDDLDFD